MRGRDAPPLDDAGGVRTLLSQGQQSSPTTRTNNYLHILFSPHRARPTCTACRFRPCLKVLALKQRQLPAIGVCVVPEDVDVVIVADHLEVAVVGCEPAIEHVVHDESSFAVCEGARRLLALIAGVALDPDRQQGVARIPGFITFRRQSAALPDRHAILEHRSHAVERDVADHAVGIFDGEKSRAIRIECDRREGDQSLLTRHTIEVPEREPSLSKLGIPANAVKKFVKRLHDGDRRRGKTAPFATYCCGGATIVVVEPRR